MKRIMSNMKQNWLIVLSAALLPTFQLIYGMLELYFNNVDEFWFTLPQMLSVALPAFLAVLLVLVLVGLFLPPKGALFYGSLLFAVGLAMYVQGNILKTDFGLLNGETINWAQYQTENWLSIAVWAVVMIGVIVLAIVKGKLLRTVIPWVSLGLVLTMTITLVTVNLSKLGDTFSTTSSEAVITKKDEFTLSKEEDNIIVFVLDTMDSGYTDTYLANSPEATEQLTGFTYFRNTVSMYGYTQVAIPHILTNQLYLNEKPYKEYLSEAYSSSDLMNALQAQHYTINIYTDMTEVAPQAYMNNVAYVTSDINNPSGFLRDLSTMVAYRYAPQAVKPDLVVYSSALNKYQNSDAMPTFIYGKDAMFYSDFLSEGLNASSSTPTFHFYHLFGAHPPYTMDENAQSATDVTKTQQISGAWKIVLDYIESLKEQGLYDNTSIVIMSDHGHDSTRICSTFMVKRAGETHAFSTSEAPVSYHDNLAATLVSLTGADTANLGITAYDVPEDATLTRLTYLMLNKSKLRTGYHYDLYGYDVGTDKHDLHSNGTLYSSLASSIDEIGIPYTLGTVMPSSEFYSTGRVLMGWGGADNDGNAVSAGSSTTLMLNIGKLPEKNLLLTIDMNSVQLLGSDTELYIGETYIGTGSVGGTKGVLRFLIPREKITSPGLIIHLRSAIPTDISGISSADLATFNWASVCLEETDLTELEPVSSDRIVLYPTRLIDAELTDAGYVIQPGGSIAGFWATLPAGQYQLSIEGEVDGCLLEMKGAIDDERLDFSGDYSSVTDTLRVLDCAVPATSMDTNFSMFNYSEKTATVTAFVLTRVDP